MGSMLIAAGNCFIFMLLTKSENTLQSCQLEDMFFFFFFCVCIHDFFIRKTVFVD